ncbi:unnamed protein product, partial [Ectocarpus sp. 12 AP-2014]
MLSLAKRIRETVTPARRTSAFLSQGVLTPEEFIEAGEQLVFKCPTWTWEAGDPSKAKDCLPDKSRQFLVTRNVPCHRRAKDLEGEYVGDTEVRQGESQKMTAAAPATGAQQDQREEQGGVYLTMLGWSPMWWPIPREEGGLGRAGATMTMRRSCSWGVGRGGCWGGRGERQI